MKTLIGLVALALSLLASVYMITTSYNTATKDNGITECLKIAQVQTVVNQGDQKQTFSQPNGGWYETCLKAKGYK